VRIHLTPHPRRPNLLGPGLHPETALLGQRPDPENHQAALALHAPLDIAGSPRTWPNSTGTTGPGNGTARLRPHPLRPPALTRAEQARLQHQPAEAESLYREALRIFERIGDLWGQAETLRKLGTCTAQDRPQAARGHLEQARERYRQLGADQVTGEITALLATLRPGHP